MKPPTTPRVLAGWAALTTGIALAGVAAAASAGCMQATSSTVDVPASQLTIEPSILDVPTPGQGALPVLVQFLESGAVVELTPTTEVTCNGTALVWTGLVYGASVPPVAPGGTLTFAYARAGVTNRVAVTVPDRPMVTSPASGAMLTRTNGLPIQYVAATSAGVRPAASDASSGVSGPEQPDNGTATLDVSSLVPGPGHVNISRRFVSSPADTGFASATVTYTITSADVPVVWQ